MSEDRIGTDEESRAEQMKIGPKVEDRTGRGREEKGKRTGPSPVLYMPWPRLASCDPSSRKVNDVASRRFAIDGNKVYVRFANETN